MPAPSIATLLDVARDLAARHKFEPEGVLQLMSTVPVDDLDLQTRGAVKHARMVTIAAVLGGPSQTAVARLALARVVVLLEAHVRGC